MLPFYYAEHQSSNQPLHDQLSNQNESVNQQQPQQTINTSVVSDKPTATTIFSHDLSSSTVPLINPSPLICSTCINTGSIINLSTTSSSLPPSSTDMNCDTKAKVNDIRNVELLDTESGLTIISFQHWSIIAERSILLTSYDDPDVHGPEGYFICSVGWITVDVAITRISIQHELVFEKI
ncbi:unnamed protein product [Rotaria sp. Silwood2]|nr:unnamed protein product [Rotaria sp. Silwood2]CAF4028516.1 unnamed protein product [Rotaria sp. Silwood2]